MALAVVLALGAGLAYAVAAVLQQRVAVRQPRELSLSPKLIVALGQHPAWLVGIAVDVGAYVLEAAALGAGSVVVVGPLLVSGLLFAIPLGTMGTGLRVTRREMVPAVLLTAGLATFVAVAAPEGDSSRASALAWVLAGTAIALVAGACVLVGRRPSTAPSRRALLFGVGTGALYGLTAVLTKAAVDLLDGVDDLGGVLGLLGHWQPYALVTVSIAGLVLNQSAFQAGHVAASLPAIAVLNPVISATLGITIFGEHLSASGVVEVTATAAAILVMVAGTVALARSPLVTHESPPVDHP